MCTARSVVLAVCLSGLAGLGVRGAEFEWLPVGASGTHTIDGNTIVLEGADQVVTLELRVSGWDPELDGSPRLSVYQATVDSSTYDNLVGNPLNPVGWPGTPTAGAYINGAHPDFVFFGMGALPAVSTFVLDYAWGATLFGTSVADGGGTYYCGTLELEVPAGALGVYTVGFVDDPGWTFLRDADSLAILPIDLTPVVISIACVTNEDCDDDNACTQDICNPDHTCSNPPNYDTEVFCCDPATGNLTPLEDGNDCTDDVCNPEDGTVTHPPFAAGTSCGDPSNTQCDNPDTCDGAGVCEPNVAPLGTPCGNPTDTECDGADTCDGAGTCADNIQPVGEPCGDPTDNDCTDPDTCDGAGNCLDHDEPFGTPCDDGLFCNVDEFCTAGACGGGEARDCGDGLSCTTDTCDEDADVCVNGLNPGFCLIAGVCYGQDERNPENDCEECDAGQATDAWTVLPEGTECDDDDPCTDDDACSAFAECLGVLNPQCNDRCDIALAVDEGVTASNNSGSAADDDEASCQPDSNHDVWFAYTAACNGEVFLSTTGSALLPSNDPVLNVFDECGGTEIACDDDSGVDLNAALVFTAIMGEDYYIRVAGFEDNVGDIVLNVDTVNDCVIGDTCYAEGELNPGNECEMCIPALSTSAWSPAPEGTPCGDPTDTVCDSPDACDGNRVCETNPKPDGTECPDDDNECTFDKCGGGLCVHPPRAEGTPCGDPSNSECDHPDTCDGDSVCLDNYEPLGTACGDPSSDQCDNPDICDGVGACDPNYKATGWPCNDGDICTGNDDCELGVCLGTPIPQAPLVVRQGPRAFDLTPQPMGSVAPVALRVSSPDWTCLDKYVGADGFLTTTPVTQLPNNWGMVIVRGADVVPSSTYDFVAECGVYASDAGSGTTCLWADVDCNDVVNFYDIQLIVLGFQGIFDQVPMEALDIDPCTPNEIINFIDVQQAVMVFEDPVGRTYASTGCPLPCP
ncbi:MAG: hypothetical protein KJ749_03550 [Planctomycetes bacterium]|nr:hypothetical protein [Planctomycetota bacterium]